MTQSAKILKINEYRDAIHELMEGIEEMCALREATRGMPIVNQESYQEMLKLRAKHAPLARMHLLNGEQRACAVFDWMYENGMLPETLPNEGEKYVKELRFSGGRKVDRAIFHKSGQLSIIEVKDACDTRSIVGGIGQALLYAALAEKQFQNTPIVPVLAVLGDTDHDIARACSRGGVEYIPLGGVGFMNTLSEITAFMIDYRG